MTDLREIFSEDTVVTNVQVVRFGIEISCAGRNQLNGNVVIVTCHNNHDSYHYWKLCSCSC